MAYERINWQNGEVGNTPLNANNLNRMDMAIEEHDQKIGDHDYEIENLKTGAQGITEELNKKMDRINPQGSGTLSITAVNADNITAQTVEADEIKVAKVGSKGGTAPVVFDNDILVNGITTPIGSLASSASAKAESASERAEDAYNLASRANREAASAINKANDNKVKIDLHTGLIGEGVGDKWAILGYTDGYYIAPNGSVTQYNATATLIQIDFLDFLFRGDNIIFNHVDLLPTENCIPCAWYDISGNFISAADGLNIIAEFDEQTSKITKQYIDYCIIPVPAGASSCKLSGLANGRADIRIQTSLSEAIKDLQSKPEPATLVLTNPSPLPATDGKKILGIDAVGRSWQETTQTLATVQGSMPTIEIGSAINQTLATSTNRCVSSVVQLPSGTKLTITSGYEMYVLFSSSANGNIESTNGWVTSREVTTNGYYRIQIRKADNSAITPTSFTLTASGMSPTPSNPIPIVDASGDVVARTVNLTDKQNTGSNLALPKALPKGTYTLSFETDMANNSFRLSNSTDTSTNSVSSGVRVSLGGNRYAITLTTTFESNYYSTNASGGTYVRNIQIEEGTTATSYVPYRSNSVTLPFEPKSVESVANELIVNEDGSAKIVQRVGAIKVGETEWSAIGGLTHCYDTPNLKNAQKNLTSGLMGSCWVSGEVNDNKFGTIGTSGTGKIRVSDTLTSVDEFKRQRANEWIYYPLATPIEKTLTAEEVAAVRQLMTYKGTTIIESEMEIKSVTYPGDVKAYVDGFHIYSTVPTICGYEEDGTPIYRVKIYTTTHNTANAAKVVEPTINTQSCNIKHMYGTFNMDGALMELNAYYNISTNRSVSLFVAPTGVALWSYSNDTLNKPCEIVVEYTLKDSAPAAASVMSLDETEE